MRLVELREINSGEPTWATTVTVMSQRPHPRHFFNNWKSSDLPFLEKIALAARNNAIKVKNRSDCCGHHGQPGC